LPRHRRQLVASVVLHQHGDEVADRCIGVLTVKVVHDLVDRPPRHEGELLAKAIRHLGDCFDLVRSSHGASQALRTGWFQTQPRYGSVVHLFVTDTSGRSGPP